ncbi:hypothetical protein Tco_0363499 [Tanacetum coccineum]
MDGFVIRTKKNNNSDAENNDMVNVNIDNENPTNNKNLENDEVNADYDNENPINIENLENDEVNADYDNENPINIENLENDRLTPQLHESAGGLPSLKLSLHSCSLLGSMNAMGIETSIALVLSAREHECDTSFVLGKPPALS